MNSTAGELAGDDKEIGAPLADVFAGVPAARCFLISVAPRGWLAGVTGGQRNGKRCIQILHESSVIDRVEKGVRAAPVGQGGDAGWRVFRSRGIGRAGKGACSEPLRLAKQPRAVPARTRCGGHALRRRGSLSPKGMPATKALPALRFNMIGARPRAPIPTFASFRGPSFANVGIKGALENL
jgi:hypothetical protein